MANPEVLRPQAVIIVGLTSQPVPLPVILPVHHPTSRDLPLQDQPPPESVPGNPGRVSLAIPVLHSGEISGVDPPLGPQVRRISRQADPVGTNPVHQPLPIPDRGIPIPDRVAERPGKRELGRNPGIRMTGNMQGERDHLPEW